MAFNDQGNGKSPWESKQNQPPDLDQIVDEWQKRFNQLFGGGGKPGGGVGPEDDAAFACVASAKEPSVPRCCLFPASNEAKRGLGEERGISAP